MQVIKPTVTAVGEQVFRRLSKRTLEPRMHSPLSVPDDAHSTTARRLPRSGSKAVVDGMIYTNCSPHNIAPVNGRPCVIHRGKQCLLVFNRRENFFEKSLPSEDVRIFPCMSLSNNIETFHFEVTQYKGILMTDNKDRVFYPTIHTWRA